MKKKLSSIFLVLLVVSLAVSIPVFKVPTAKANPGWLSGWSYRKSHVINSSTGAGTNYQIPFTVHRGSGTDSGADVYLGGKCRCDFGDVRFADDDGSTLLDYSFENFDNGCKANGINMPIHTLIRPAGLYHNGRTYIVWQGASKHPYVSYLNHSTKLWSSDYQVGTNPLGDDNHGHPCIVRDNSGYFHVFYGCHNTLIQYAKSTNTDDISAWTDKGDVGQTGTYPKSVVNSNGDIYLFYRGYNIPSSGLYSERFIKSSNGGTSWSSPVTIIEANSSYKFIYATVFFDVPNGKVHYAWWRCTAVGGDHYNAYYAYFKFSDGHMYDINDNDLGTTITMTEADSNCKVYDSGTKEMAQVNLWVYNGKPHIVFTYLDSYVYYKFVKWTGSAWTTPVTITSVTGYTTLDPTSAIRVKDSNNLEVYLSTYSSGISGDLERWTSSNGGTNWSKDTTLIDRPTETEHGILHSHFVQDQQSIFRVLFGEYKNDFTTSLKVYAYGDEGFILANDVDVWVEVADDLRLSVVNP